MMMELHRAALFSLLNYRDRLDGIYGEIMVISGVL